MPIRRVSPPTDPPNLEAVGKCSTVNLHDIACAEQPLSPPYQSKLRGRENHDHGATTASVQFSSPPSFAETPRARRDASRPSAGKLAGASCLASWACSSKRRWNAGTSIQEMWPTCKRTRTGVLTSSSKFHTYNFPLFGMISHFLGL